MNKQELFTTVRDHLMRQNARALNVEGSGCAYHATNGLKCAIGCLLTPEQALLVEGLDVRSPEFEPIARNIGLTDDLMVLARDLQNCHDQAPVDSWQQELMRIAAQHDVRWGC